MNIQHSESVIGRPAKPGETPNKKGIPVTTPRSGRTPAQGSKPRPQA
ncbi:hypothetical protein [Streptomyces sp. NBC_00847]|nr:hypothetical protein [Streptomyces sp. NBC_00847]MCX4886083.1 hypothetical protein [Streptomyces sp. NBC_00847]